jgi:transcriptional regulator with XRE-family HTH domain
MNSKFSQRLKILRKERGLTQEELSRLSGVSFPTISRYENGLRDEPKLTILKTLANFFEVTLDFMAGDTDTRDVNFTSTEIGRLFDQLDNDGKMILMGLAKSLLKKDGKL